MSEPRVIQADFTNWRTVAGRKVLQLILEVPIEQSADVMNKLGFPVPGESKWCAVALMEKKAPVAQRTEQQSSNLTGEGSNPSGRTKFKDLPLSQQAAIRCGDEDFQKYCGVIGAEAAAARVRNYCLVQSRKFLDEADRTVSRDHWRRMEEGYQRWLTTLRYAESVR